MNYFKNPELTYGKNKEIKMQNIDLSKNWFKSSKIKKVSFNFFVNHSTKKLQNDLYIKKIFKNKNEELNFELNFNNNKKKLEDELYKEYSNYNLFKKIYNFKIFYLIFNDYSENTNIYLYEENSGLIQITELTLKSIIFNNTGIRMPRFKNSTCKNLKDCICGQCRKELIWYESKLEKKLSDTDTPFPGDIDLVCIDEQGFVMVILEYQKKNKNKNKDKDNFEYLKDLINKNKSNQNLKYDNLIKFKNYINEINLNNKINEINLIIIHYTHNKIEVEKIIDKNLTKIFTYNNYKNIVNLEEKFLLYLSYFIDKNEIKNRNFFYKNKLKIEFKNDSILSYETLEEEIIKTIGNKKPLFISFECIKSNNLNLLKLFCEKNGFFIINIEKNKELYKSIETEFNIII